MVRFWEVNQARNFSAPSSYSMNSLDLQNHMYCSDLNFTSRALSGIYFGVYHIWQPLWNFKWYPLFHLKVGMLYFVSIIRVQQFLKRIRTYGCKIYISIIYYMNITLWDTVPLELLKNFKWSTGYIPGILHSRASWSVMFWLWFR